MDSTDTASPFAAFSHPDFRRYELSRLATTLGLQMKSVAVGWQVYALTHSPFALGMVGLVQFLPMLLLALLTGHTADRYDRRLILVIYQSVLCACAIALLALTVTDAASRFGVWPFYCVLVVLGVARAFAGPAGQALMPSLVSTAHFSNAVAWNSSIWQVATVLGPALGGAIYAWSDRHAALGSGAALVYAAFGGLTLVSLAAMLAIRTRTGGLERGTTSWSLLLAGVRYVRDHQILLGAISLDLFAVLFGGAVALLPAYANDILHVGPLGLGLLRSAPAAGAAVMAVFLAFRPLKRRAGAMMLGCVAIFGGATCVFAVSTNIVLSLIALVIIGASDLVSVFVRSTLVQLQTPPAMRGRVGAVNDVFVGASNELGEFESGITAAWWGVVPATIIGGLGTLAVVALWAWRFPALRRADRLEPHPPDDASTS